MKLIDRPLKDLLLIVIPWLTLVVGAVVLVSRLADPAPPNRLVISTSNDEGDYQAYAKQYQEILKEDGVDLIIRPSSGAAENLKRLKDDNSDVEAGFVQDGLGNPDEAPDLSSLGSLYFEPIWIFYRWNGKELSRMAQLEGKRVALGPVGGGTRSLAARLLSQAGVNATNSKFLDLAWDAAASALRKGDADAAIFLGTPDEPLIKDLIGDKHVRLMSLDQAEAITRQIPFLHHLVLPHGAMDLRRGLPERDVDLVSPTATLLVKDSLHPALVYLLLKAASQVHSEPGIFEKKDEFPTDKDYEFPLSAQAKSYYKSGVPFWQRYLPFWLAVLVDRFVLLAIPALALVLPMIRLIPRAIQWRVRTRIYHRYGELKFLETQVRPDSKPEQLATYLDQLDRIEEHVNHMKVPLGFTEHIYGLRGHIDFVRARVKSFTSRARKTV